MSKGRKLRPSRRHLRELAATVERALPGGQYRLCPCGMWHLFDAECPTGASDALTWWDFVEGADR